MKRQIINELKKWAESEYRLPLLIRGARQVGKTYVVEHFAEAYFPQSIMINFELEPEYINCFDSLKPQEIINNIQALKGQMIIKGKTLLFLDEIQNCPRAIMSLRYFKEQLPELHIIGAGSLLEFALNDEQFTMPVGRVQFLYLKPLSFQEFLQARGFDFLLDAIKQCSVKYPLTSVLHEQLLKLIREYLVIGGMPAAIQMYLNTQDYLETQRIQTVILSTYRNDFGKYAKLNQHKYLQSVFSKSPGLVGQQIKFNKIDAETRSRDLKQAIELLTQAGLLQPILATTASGLPLFSLVNEKKFKLLFLDVGLVTRSSGIVSNEFFNQEINLINQGAIAEQFVGQELLAYQDCYEEAQLYFWTREQKSSIAEVDYVININSSILPIEVKAGNTGRLKSLQIMLAEKKLPLGIKVSQQALTLENNILSIPFYLLGELKRLVLETLTTTEI